MSTFLKMSEASSLAFHTMAYLALHGDRLVSTQEISKKLGASGNHLSKILQRLVHSGFVRSTRGPSGGFRIREGWESVKLLDIYEAIEGPLGPSECFLDIPVCQGHKCALGALAGTIDAEVRKCLTETTIADLAKTFPMQD